MLQRYAKSLLAVFGILLFSRGLYLVIGGLSARDLADTGDESGLLYVALSGLVYALSAAYCLPRLSPLLAIFARNRLLLALIALCFCSALWSVNPLISLSRSVSLVGTLFFALFLATAFKPLDLIRLLALSAAGMALASIVVSLALPDIGLQDTGRQNIGNWRGIFEHKNIAAYVLLGGVLNFIYLLRCDPRHRTLYWAGLTPVVFMLLQTESRTAFLMGAITLLLYVLSFTLSRMTSKGLVLIFGLALMIAPLVYLGLANFDDFLIMIGRDPTFTGRTKIWDIAIEYGMNTPFLGHGYQAAWRDPNGLPSLIETALNFNPSHSHNGYIDLFIGIGSLGLLLYLLWMTGLMLQLFRTLRRRPDELAAWGLSFALRIALLGLSARTILQPNTMDMVYLMIVAVYAGLDLQQSQHSPHNTRA